MPPTRARRPTPEKQARTDGNAAPSRELSLFPPQRSVVGRYVDHLDEDLVSNDPIDHPILLVEPRRSVSAPLSSQRLVAKSPNGSEANRPRDSYDVEVLCSSTVLEYGPHLATLLHTINGMSRLAS